MRWWVVMVIGGIVGLGAWATTTGLRRRQYLTPRVRNVGPSFMRSAPQTWERADDLSDASFPASDPPATY
jgi:hypothetical protein